MGHGNHAVGDGVKGQKETHSALSREQTGEFTATDITYREFVNQ
jgi:hypothetical protein